MNRILDWLLDRPVLVACHLLGLMAVWVVWCTLGGWTVLTVANWAAAILLAAFLLLYAPSPGWRSPYGRTIFAMKVAVLMLAAAGLWRRHDMEPAPVDDVLILGYAAIAYVMGWRLAMLWTDLRHPNRTDT